MKITSEEVAYVAKLAHLNMTQAEVESMTKQLDTILNYVDKLGELNTDGIKPTTHAVANQNAFRDDEVKQSLTREEALANGPLQNGEAFVVSRVI
jgi:aspartyl-tRNA(Asn)/glutamyl-tRNA(Gln) amidotransferase subunit C